MAGGARSKQDVLMSKMIKCNFSISQGLAIGIRSMEHDHTPAGPLLLAVHW